MKMQIKNVGKVSLVFLLCFIGILLFGTTNSVYGKSPDESDDYDPEAAIEYAKANWYSEKSSDCANFVSQCISAGGVDVEQSSVRSLYNLLTENMGYSSEPLSTEYTRYGMIVPADKNPNVSIGDILFVFCPECNQQKGMWKHAVIMGGIDSKGYITIYGHSNPKNNERMYADDQHSEHNNMLQVYVVHMTKSNIDKKETVVSVSNVRAPQNVCLKRGGVFGLRGVVQCTGDNIKILSGYIVERNTKEIIQKSSFEYKDSTTVVNIKDTINNELLFDKLAEGEYLYRVIVETDSGEKVIIVESEFDIVDVSKQ